MILESSQTLTQPGCTCIGKESTRMRYRHLLGFHLQRRWRDSSRGKDREREKVPSRNWYPPRHVSTKARCSSELQPAELGPPYETTRLHHPPLALLALFALNCLMLVYYERVKYIQSRTLWLGGTYSFLQNPWRERTTSSRPRKILPGTPPNARRRHIRYINII